MASFDSRISKYSIIVDRDLIWMFTTVFLYKLGKDQNDKVKVEQDETMEPIDEDQAIQDEV